MDPSPSPREEVILFSLFAIGPDGPYRVRELAAVAELIGMGPPELAGCLRSLHARGLVEFGGGTDQIHLAPAATALVLQLAEERLTDNILRQRSIQEQAEALVIWRLENR